MSEWISVKDRLPESQADVLVVAFWHERWQTMMGWHSDMGKKWRVITPHGEREPGGVTHWMPLPDPPKEGFELELLQKRGYSASKMMPFDFQSTKFL